MASTIIRITMFKIPAAEDQDAVLAAYETLSTTNKKDGKPYILSCHAYKLHDDPRSQDFTVLGKTCFSSLDDMKYYDTECEAHGKLKTIVGPRQQGVMTVYMDSDE